jgi:hypothetical protein
MSKPIKVCLILGEAKGFCTPEETRAALDNGYGSRAMREFKTPAERKAYMMGIEDMSGLDGYDVVTEAYYAKVTKAE